MIQAVPLSHGEVRALAAVAAGKVERVYRPKGHVLRGERVSSHILWHLDRRGFIADGPTTTGAGIVELRCTQALTAAGLQALAQVSPQAAKINTPR